MWSRPKTRPNSAAVNGITAAIPPPERRSRSAGLPSLACTNRAIRSALRHSRAACQPATACPARRASPSRSAILERRPWCSNAGRPGGTTTGPRAARVKAPRLMALSSTSPRALNHIPRPGSLSAKSGTISRPGPSTNRIISALGRLSRVAMQRRSGPFSGSSSSGRARASAVSKPLRRPWATGEQTGAACRVPRTSGMSSM